MNKKRNLRQQIIKKILNYSPDLNSAGMILNCGHWMEGTQAGSFKVQISQRSFSSF